jgi:hypothetical protein
VGSDQMLSHSSSIPDNSFKHSFLEAIHGAGGAPRQAQVLTAGPEVVMVVYWYLFSNHYTRECIHTGERDLSGSSRNGRSPFCGVV